MKIRELKGRGSIKAKLIGIIIPMMIVIISLLITVSYNKSKGIITKSANDLLETSSKKQVDQIEAWLNENLASFKAVKTSLENTQLNNDQLQNFLNKYYNYSDNYPEGFYIGDEDGNMLKANGSKKSDKNVIDSVWYKEGLTRLNMEYGSAYKNEEGKNTISASAILNDKSGKTKVLSTDIYLDKISIIVNSMIEMDNAEAFLVDNSDKTILSHGDSSLISTKLDSNNKDKFLKEVAVKLENGKYDSCELENNMVVFKEIEGTNWILVSYVPTKSIFSELTKLRTFMIAIAIISIILLTVLVERVVHVVIKPIKELTKTIMAMTTGDFTVDVEVKGNDEISVMLKSVKEFIAVMRNMINKINAVSGKMNDQADGSIVISKELYDSSKLESESMKNLNVTVDQLSCSVSEIAESTTTLATVVSTTKDDGSNVNQKMKETISISEKGRQDMEKVNIAMENIRNSISSLEEAINNVGKSSAEITNIVNVIGEISEQTNLLSLNASIEAARAGEAGRGFAVVANEIGKLANTSSESVKNISALVNQIKKLVSDTVKQSHESADYINESSYLISGTVDTFDDIFNKINGTNNLIQDMIKKVGHLDEVAATVAAISEEQAASSQEILATSEVMVTQSSNITKNSEKVANDAKELSNTSEELSKQIQMFKI
ncbi:methyl-accepting chemotaxis protein [Clostridium saccharobutylicum]|uniref:Methyl-accepting chemotaxis protein n=1 Tax=Clostridium saccharobutylicum DSM 13864 TaxID=1345695 RepID=U5MT13_CLOSA|nr:methyl-accepting chemotaxis protein [Clostridium saccharobutylicum]AGX42806.1 methyl-accepting chemotaxis protein [Clostridium saccharobutylicum DSM 13864]AQR90103.1 methyl-accepting chemotaxis protein PctB [Clostridium saccharobutylicum]AQS00009.1 methyl-accepting chemotaxis protein PctB [Clostridium saccharobutylicum]AQS09794.1 methyl-accepting chemotaxis protein PctB [Clostridium saccharobutylicum]AQS13992.1 methyl-accepting chemotaxis protein PctB [Clostridium saccharobutylicum]